MQQPATIGAQFPGQLRRADPLGDASQEQHDLHRRVVGAVPQRAGEGIEAPATSLAAVVHDGGPVAFVDVALGQPVAVGAAQAFGVQQEDEFVVTRLGIEEMGDRKVHGQASMTRLAERPYPAYSHHRPFDPNLFTPERT